jgi:hypothetical protein
MTAVWDDYDEEEALVSPCATPTTPHKKKRERRVSLLDKGKGREELLFSPHTESLPSSPSPIKARTPYVKEKILRRRRSFWRSSTGQSDGVVDDENRDENDGNETVKETPPSRVLRSRAMRKQPELPIHLPSKHTRAKRQRADKSKTPSDPVELAQKLISRLPKRRNKKRKDGEEEEGEPEEIKSRRTKRQRKPQMPKKRVKDVKRLKAELEVCFQKHFIMDYP